MTGEEWLRGPFDQALRRSNPPLKELRGAVRALSECGQLAEESVSDANARLDETEGERHAIVRSRAERVRPPGSHAQPPRDRLEGLLTPGRPIADVDGITVVLVLVELWTSRVTLRLEALRNALTDALDAEYDAEWRAYQERWSGRPSSAYHHEDDDGPPDQPSVARLGGLPLSLADDVGTRYHAVSGATGGPDPWRSEWRLEPGVPTSATVLTLGLEEGESEPQRVELVLPDRT
ncbi:MAG: hypothetical protein ACLQMH_17350 [Solirubrobacteraceae bacterium]